MSVFVLSHEGNLVTLRKAGRQGEWERGIWRRKEGGSAGLFVIHTPLHVAAATHESLSESTVCGRTLLGVYISA